MDERSRSHELWETVPECVTCTWANHGNIAEGWRRWRGTAGTEIHF